MIKSYSKLICISFTAIFAFGTMPGTAWALTKCNKPPLTAKGMFYTTQKKAKDSADYRWGLKAASVHGQNWGHVGKAKGKSYACTSGHGKSGNLFNCKLTATPCAKIVSCKNPLTAKGMFYTTKDKAKESADYRWGLKSASVHGQNWGHVGKAKGKSYTCTSGHGKSGNLFNCKLTAKPCI